MASKEEFEQSLKDTYESKHGPLSKASEEPSDFSKAQVKKNTASEKPNTLEDTIRKYAKAYDSRKEKAPEDKKNSASVETRASGEKKQGGGWGDSIVEEHTQPM